MATITYLSAPVDVTPTADGTFQDVDVTANVTNASGVMLRVEHTGASTLDFFVRKNGSTDASPNTHIGSNHAYVSIGIDADDIFECLLESGATWTVELLGYYDDTDVVFFDNAVDLTTATHDSWETVTVTGTSGTPAAAIVTMYTTQGSGNDAMGIRAVGSTDDRTGVVRGPRFGGTAVVGLDGSQQLQKYTDTQYSAIEAVGYFKSGTITTLTNATDVSLTSTGSWLLLPSLPSDIDVGFFEVHNATNTNVYNFGFAPEDDTDFQDFEGTPRSHTWGASGSVSNGIDGYISNTNVDYFLTAYTTTATASSASTPQGLQGLYSGVNPQRSTRLGGELQ